MTIGRRFGTVTVLERIRVSHGQHSKALCLCDCGMEFVTCLRNLRSGHTRSCGCLRSPTVYSGQKFGRWTLISPSTARSKSRMWVCGCDCGTIKDVRVSLVINGTTMSCGCSRRVTPEMRAGQKRAVWHAWYARNRELVNLTKRAKRRTEDGRNKEREQRSRKKHEVTVGQWAKIERRINK